jgi:hypothetical protein
MKKHTSLLESIERGISKISGYESISGEVSKTYNKFSDIEFNPNRVV